MTPAPKVSCIIGTYSPAGFILNVHYLSVCENRVIMLEATPPLGTVRYDVSTELMPLLLGKLWRLTIPLN